MVDILYNRNNEYVEFNARGFDPRDILKDTVTEKLYLFDYDLRAFGESENGESSSVIQIDFFEILPDGTLLNVDMIPIETCTKCSKRESRLILQLIREKKKLKGDIR